MKVRFEGVIVSFESMDERRVQVYGSIEGAPAEFTLVVSEDKFNELLRLGIGQRIEGEAIKVSDSPLVLRLD
ncbi:hypothetical protein TCELL_0574 [Thermogladius calderae 1633]|uniref:Uncharacterized protein n=1 Tax=Thermogladius calderae (strain DSM 22663 / VKM B-2946 / 1633) TaxID=1184251 RepID=I3TE11_THEC1|nr:hypothetical protein [Thermogladius calderae]AFK50999.1 hypothetical protein TCELL_0574 [Thermogladius calderae 1633]